KKIIKFDIDLIFLIFNQVFLSIDTSQSSNILSSSYNTSIHCSSVLFLYSSLFLLNQFSSFATKLLFLSQKSFNLSKIFIFIICYL
ncbi:MAG: hypothetical protein P1U46_02885, partial [Patescibacteria group bacterium]|nr:hypothetical protein [Patescibacteria group bacterium]